MKARNPSTGNLETVYVKALDSMSVGTEVDFIGNVSDIPTGWEQVSEYSTTEINTGKVWIDGKPIYRKTFNGTFENSTNILTGVSSLVSVYGTADSGTGIQRIIPYYEVYQNNPFCARLNFSNNNVVTDGLLNGTSHSITGKFTVEYTKTTD